MTNANGVAWNAEPLYIQLINQFNQDEALIAITSFANELIASRLQFELCQQKFMELLNLIKGKISASAIKELVEAIEGFPGPLDKIKEDSRIKQKIDNMWTILNA